MNEQVTAYIAKQPPLQKALCTKLRQLFLQNFPQIQEEMFLGVPYYDKKFYMVALKDHVNFGFSIKNFSIAEIAKFASSGKTVKVLELYSLADIDQKLIVGIIKKVL
jgi:hypothetical protein